MEEQESTLSERQRLDPDLQLVIAYLENDTLPDNDRKAREMVFGKTQYTMDDRVLYRIESDKTLRVVVPKSARQNLFNEAHSGKYGGHLREAKIHSQLSRHYWWPGMRQDITKWCRVCLVCATRSVGKPIKPFLTPIPVEGPFDRIGVDVLQLPKSNCGNRYTVVFMDYLTKWPEVFPTCDQTAPTIAKLLVEKVICRHGVPRELLSDRGASFLSKLVAEVCSLMGIKKLNTTAYHPQTDGLVEQFNRTLLDMLLKTVKSGGQDCPYVLFAYWAMMQHSTGESLFFLLYGWDPQLPTEAALCPPVVRNLMCIKSQMLQALSSAWKLAQQNVKKTQQKQKKQHDKKARDIVFNPGD